MCAFHDFISGKGCVIPFLYIAVWTNNSVFCMAITNISFEMDIIEDKLDNSVTFSHDQQGCNSNPSKGF